MLADAPLMAFASTVDLDRARAFYEGMLGLPVEEVNDFACVFHADGTTLRVTKVDSLTPQPFTVLGWQVEDIASIVDGLAARGITFERYDFMSQDDRGIWTAPSGARIAWFTDPDGNVLSVTQFA